MTFTTIIWIAVGILFLLFLLRILVHILGFLAEAFEVVGPILFWLGALGLLGFGIYFLVLFIIELRYLALIAFVFLGAAVFLLLRNYKRRPRKLKNEKSKLALAWDSSCSQYNEFEGRNWVIQKGNPFKTFYREPTAKFPNLNGLGGSFYPGPEVRDIMQNYTKHYTNHYTQHRLLFAYFEAPTKKQAGKFLVLTNESRVITLTDCLLLTEKELCKNFKTIKRILTKNGIEFLDNAAWIKTLKRNKLGGGVQPLYWKGRRDSVEGSVWEVENGRSLEIKNHKYQKIECVYFEVSRGDSRGELSLLLSNNGEYEAVCLEQNLEDLKFNRELYQNCRFLLKVFKFNKVRLVNKKKWVRALRKHGVGCGAQPLYWSDKRDVLQGATWCARNRETLKIENVSFDKIICAYFEAPSKDGAGELSLLITGNGEDSIVSLEENLEAIKHANAQEYKDCLALVKVFRGNRIKVVNTAGWFKMLKTHGVGEGTHPLYWFTRQKSLQGARWSVENAHTLEIDGVSYKQLLCAYFEAPSKDGAGELSLLVATDGAPEVVYLDNALMAVKIMNKKEYADTLALVKAFRSNGIPVLKADAWAQALQENGIQPPVAEENAQA